MNFGTDTPRPSVPTQRREHYDFRYSATELLNIGHQLAIPNYPEDQVPLSYALSI
jgi:hypothetical protein